MCHSPPKTGALSLRTVSHVSRGKIARGISPRAAGVVLRWGCSAIGAGVSTSMRSCSRCWVTTTSSLWKEAGVLGRASSALALAALACRPGSSRSRMRSHILGPRRGRRDLVMLAVQRSCGAVQVFGSQLSASCKQMFQSGSAKSRGTCAFLAAESLGASHMPRRGEDLESPIRKQ